MKLTPFRTAVIAGTCTVALSFTALPAFAADPVADGTDTTAVSMTSDDGSTVADDDTTATATATDDGDVADDSDSDAIDDDETDSDDATDDSDASQNSTPVEKETPKPAEQGKPKQRIADTTLSPKVFAKKGFTVTFTGLTAGAAYQPYYSTTAMGDAIGDPKKADAKGRLSYTWKPAEGRVQPGDYNLGLAGEDTSLNVRTPVRVKYASDVTWDDAKRAGKKVTLSAAVHRTAASGKQVIWKKAFVEFQKKVGSRWVTVAQDRADSKGLAKVTVSSGVQTWRAVADPDGTVFGSETSGRKQ